LKLLPWEALLTWLTLPLAWKWTRVVFSQTGQTLNAALGGTGLLALAYSLLFLFGMLLAG
jgi:1,4-dihydroxy-2-naphthoate octaprenyltransferase